jgi:hypothetical protein
MYKNKDLTPMAPMAGFLPPGFAGLRRGRQRSRRRTEPEMVDSAERRGRMVAL